MVITEGDRGREPSPLYCPGLMFCVGMGGGTKGDFDLTCVAVDGGAEVEGSLFLAVPLLLCPKSDFEADMTTLSTGDETDEEIGLVNSEGFGEFAPLRKSAISGGFFEVHRVMSSLVVSSLESESVATIHFADNRDPSCGLPADCGRNPGDDITRLLSLGIGDDLPIA